MPIYMKYEGIEGTATGKHKGWIELESCQLGTSLKMSNPMGAGENRENSRILSSGEIVITKISDTSNSTQLFRESLQGEGKKVVIDFVKNDATVYLSIALENTIISSYSISGNSSGENRPMETISLNFTKIIYKVIPAASKNP